MTEKNHSLMNTAKDAIIGKKSASRCGKARDTNALSMSKSKSQVPILNKVYISRMIGISHVFQSYLQACKESGVTNMQVLVLGAGYDTSFNRCGLDVYLVDFEEVIQARTCQNIDSSAKSVTLLVGDLRQPEQLLASLINNKFDVLAPVFVVLESVLAYMDLVSAQTLLQFMATKIQHLCGVIYDPILPTRRDSPFFRCAAALQETFSSRHVPLLSAQRSVLEMCVFLRRCGMRHVQSIDMQGVVEVTVTAVAKDSMELFNDAAEESEPFDEFAALATLHKLYALSYFSNGNEATDLTLFNAMTSHFFCSSRRNVMSSAAKAVRLQALEHRLQSWELVHPVVNNHCRDKNIRIREARHEDERDILTMFNEGHNDWRVKYPAVQSHMKHAVKVIKSTLKSDYTREPSGMKGGEQGGFFWVAEDLSLGDKADAEGAKKRRVVGCVSLRLTTSSSDDSGQTRVMGILSHLSVREDSRRRGIGRGLVQKAIEVARTARCSALDLTTLTDMIAARALYASMGFQEVDITDIGHDCKLVHMVFSL